MAVSFCSVKTDEQGKELVPHGMAMFPMACYDEDFSVHLVPWHWHEDFEMIMITEGCSHIHVEDTSITLHKGDALLVNSGVLHSVNNGAPEDAHCHSIVFHPRLIGGSVDSVFWQNLVNPIIQNASFRYQRFGGSASWQAAVIADMSAAWQAVADETDDYENYVRYLLSRAFHTLNLNTRTTAVKAVAQTCLPAERTKTMMQFIHEHFTEDLSREQIADSAAVSKSVCLRCFTQVIGITPVRYVIQYRIEKAAQMLLTTDKKANEVATSCGFSDISYFTKCFREWKGYTPLEYRKEFAQAARHLRDSIFEETDNAV